MSALAVAGLELYGDLSEKREVEESKRVVYSMAIRKEFSVSTWRLRPLPHDMS